MPDRRDPSVGQVDDRVALGQGVHDLLDHAVVHDLDVDIKLHDLPPGLGLVRLLQNEKSRFLRASWEMPTKIGFQAKIKVIYRYTLITRGSGGCQSLSPNQ